MIEVAQLCLKLGCIAFGGPTAHIALMREEEEEFRRRWIDEQHFLDLLGASNLNVASLALMAAVTAQRGRAALVDALTIGRLVAAGVLLIRFKIHSAWLVLAGA